MPGEVELVRSARSAPRRLRRRPWVSCLRSRLRENQDHLFSLPLHAGLKPPLLPSPARSGRRKPGLHFAGEAGQAGAWPGPDPRSPALRLRPRAAASPASLPSPFLPRGSRGRPRPSQLGIPPSPHPRPPRLAPGSGAGPVTSSPVWRRRDWPARAIKRATSSFPITHCQSGNWGGPAGN